MKKISPNLKNAKVNSDKSLFFANSFFILQKPNNVKCKIVHKKENNLENKEEKKKEFNLDIFKKYDENYAKISLDANKKKILLSSDIPINHIAKHFYAFSFILNGAYILNDYKLYISTSNDATHYNLIDTISNIKKNPKVDRLLMNKVSLSLYTKIKFFPMCEREKEVQNYKLTHISYIFRLLKEGGTLFISIMNYCINSTFEILYILSLMFEKVIIYKGTHIYCHNFKSDKSQITEQQILQFIDNSFTIKPKFQWNELVRYLEKSFKNYNNSFRMIINKKYDDFFYTEWKDSIQLIKFKEKEKTMLNNGRSTKLIDIESKNIYNSYYYFKNKINKYKTVIEFNKNIFMRFNKLFIGNELIKFDEDSMLISEIYEFIRTKNIINCLELGNKDKGIFSFVILSVKHTKLYSNNTTNKKLLKTYGFSNRCKFVLMKHKTKSSLGLNYGDKAGIIQNKCVNKNQIDMILIHNYEFEINNWIDKAIQNYGYILIYKSSSMIKYLKKNSNFLELESNHSELFIFQKKIKEM
jgi:hypothetical protein